MIQKIKKFFKRNPKITFQMYAEEIHNHTRTKLKLNDLLDQHNELIMDNLQLEGKVAQLQQKVDHYENLNKPESGEEHY